MEAHFGPATQRQQGLMDDGKTTLNTSHFHLYTPVWLGCPASLGTCSLSPER
ncbi:hypothetical protein [Spirosoma radiotolerans]|uniref:hypothetical protein n=1 Tax=Spirosoma radiotolerans TaxID=1379870 RepID=UPI00130E9537|nr:hypothetical protein [Spirosoma radiotolerans]